MLLALVCFVSHRLKPPFTLRKRRVREEQHDDGSADVENDWPRVYYATGERSHVFDCQEIPSKSRVFPSHQQNELNQAQKK